ncbi:hypothetical protein [Kribbella sp. C-35]|uniref:hypothetical protein n=1 Tax=Kribbella sp. C-35 TaxID=2789276 RepID=UPI00397A0A5F
MARIVFRIRMMSGDHLDVIYEEPGAADDVTIQHAVTALAGDNGLLRCRHGDRDMVLFARGVAAVEIAPRGAVL